jgi:hypothetical protein
MQKKKKIKLKLQNKMLKVKESAKKKDGRW